MQMRYLVLTALFAIGAVLHLGIDAPAMESQPRWPQSESVFAVDGWMVSPPSVDDSRPGIAYVTRVYQRAADGAQVSLVISTSPINKAIYRAGADVPFLGNGFEVMPAPLVVQSPARQAILATRAGETWLQVSAYGERRGLLGNGAQAWTWTIVDSILGRPNDYYLVRLAANDLSLSSEVASLADQLFPRIATWFSL
jgi:hypothetical protein